MKLTVRYTATFEAEIEVEDDVPFGTDLMEKFSDEISEIDIPEGGLNCSQYQSDSFEILSVE